MQGDNQRKSDSAVVPPSLESIMARRPSDASLHKRSRTSSSQGGAAVDIDKMIERSGCASVYYALEECLGEHDRNWVKCQNAVRDLKTCAGGATSSALAKPPSEES
jgi:hypothetical protein